MHYERRAQRDSIPRLVPMLLASGAMGLLAIAWRLHAAPRRSARLASGVAPNALLKAAPRVPDADVQSVHCGTGCIFHRRYEVELAGTSSSAADVMRLMQRHLADLCPSLLAHFEKSAGRDGVLHEGDEYEIRMLGPWNGMVRVAESTHESFTLATLDGHPEAGHITFSVVESEDAPLHVRIESWARARDSVVATAYHTLRVGKQIQTEAWITFLQRLSALAGVEGTPEVQIGDEEIPVGNETTGGPVNAPRV